MKKTIILAVGCLLTLAAHADTTYGYLTFTQNSLVEQSFATTDLTITFADGQAVVTQGTQQTVLPLKDLQKMYFSAVPAGVDEVNADADSQLTVLTLAGQAVGTFKDATAMKNRLKKGLYIVKTTGRTFKYEVR